MQASADSRRDIHIEADLNVYLKALKCMRVLRGDMYTEVDFAVIWFRQE